MTERELLKLRDLAEHTVVQLQDTNEMLTSMASDNVVSGISLVTENVEMSGGGAVMVVTVRRGQNIPYRDNRDNGGVARVPYKNLPPQWKNVIQYCTIPKSAREIIAHLGYQYHSKYIAEIIRPLVKMNYLEMMVPDKPNSKNQKYRKVEKR